MISASASENPEQAVRQLQDRLRRYPAAQYPVQHATAQFHLGVTYLRLGEAAGAVEALTAARHIFRADQLPLERAKATNMLGAALRMGGDAAGAADVFSRAAEAFEQQDRPKEHAAALFNCGLAQREGGDKESAAASFGEALRRFREQRLPAQTSAAARELGATLLDGGDIDAAARALTEAVEMARAAGDRAALGAAANALGLAHLAAGRLAEATESLGTAVATHPRTLHPEGYAMAKANLALAHERAGDAARGRLAARQALATPGAPPPVCDQALGVLQRLGAVTEDLVDILDTEPAERWPLTIRDEVVRWMDVDSDERRIHAGAWIDAQVARSAAGSDLAKAWLGVLLEQPPAAMETVIRSTLEALAEREQDSRERFRAQISRAMPHYPLPQWTRLEESFARIAADVGDGTLWE